MRSIPACAGEPQSPWGVGRAIEVYPRVCGGTLEELEEKHGADGLSPRVRGNQPYINVKRFLARSIPACAGEPHPMASIAAIPTVYPRVCGGTLTPFSEMRRDGGLSPRVRGNLTGLPDGSEATGSIPACAGEPGRHWGISPVVEVYPRVCGGTSIRTGAQRQFNGLSPRVRGNPRLTRIRSR